MLAAENFYGSVSRFLIQGLQISADHVLAKLQYILSKLPS